MASSATFEKLIDAHSRELFAYLWRMVQDDDEAQDCLQETFLRAYRAFGRLDGNANYRAWLYRIATNVSLTHLRRRSRETNRQVALPRDLPATGPTPDQRAIVDEQLRAVARAVVRLPTRQRSALILRKYQELEYAEIAAVLDCSQDAARANVYQALRKLRRELSDDQETR